VDYVPDEDYQLREVPELLQFPVHETIQRVEEDMWWMSAGSGL
jgi:hypothetical protein